MTNYEVMHLANALKEVDAPDMEPAFNYAISDTLSHALEIREHIRKALTPSEEYQAYEEVLSKLREEHAEKDEDGEAKFMYLENGSKQYIIPGIEFSDSPFNKAAGKLMVKYSEVIEKRQKQMKFLQEENEDFRPHEINKEDIPKGLSRSAMDTVYLLMKWTKH